MAAPKFAPAGSQGTTHYSSPDVVPDRWSPDRPGIVDGLQPVGRRLGPQGPDQGYALTLAARLVPRLQLRAGERAGDAVQGCVAIALRRASLFSRAPVIHDLNVAFTIWGYLDPDPPSDLVARRATLFEGVGNLTHHYAECRAIADMVPEATLRMTPEQVAAAYPTRWAALTGVDQLTDDAHGDH
jgi:hypothetical protein